MNKILKHLMDPAIERVVKSFLNGLGIKNIKDIDSYQDIIKLGKYQNKQVDLNKIVLLSYQLLEKEPNVDYIYILLYLTAQKAKNAIMNEVKRHPWKFYPNALQ